MTVTGANALPSAVDGALTMLHRAGTPLAPHVAMRVSAAVVDDEDAILQIAAALSPAQRAGMAALPDPLPAVSAVSAACTAALESLTDPERRLLLAVSVSVDARADVVLAASALTMSEALAGGASAHIVVAAGRVTFTDPRVRIVVHGSSSLADRTSVHAALAHAYGDAGDARLAIWHRSLSTLEGDPALTEPLLALAAVAHRSGAAEWAHAVAREAASHATGAGKLRAHVAAGEAALDAGLIDDAVEWLRDAVAAADAVIASQALPAFVHAVALRDGSVPDTDISRLLTRLHEDPDADLAVATGISRALATAACRHAERGHGPEGVALLAAADEIAPTPLAARTASTARAWCALFDGGTGGSVDVEDVPPSSHDDAHAAYARIAHALEAARRGECEHALGALRGGAGATMAGVSPWAADLAHPRVAPLVEAHRRVAIALVEFWAGDLARARAELADAALALPVGLPFAGLAVALGRRLDACTDGDPLATTRALEDTHAAPHTRLLRSELLVDRAIRAHLEGRVAEAATLLSLAAEGAPRHSTPGLPLPGLDSPTSPAAHRGGSPGGDFHDAREHSRLASPFDRARAEMATGRASAMGGDLDEARGHLLAASGLFDTSGAAVWRDACEADLALLPAETRVSVLTQPIPVVAADAPAVRPDPAARATPAPSLDFDDEVERACRDAWADTLTDREQEVALLVVQGSSNREVAQELYVSVRTVEVHLGRVFAKLGVASRVALSVQAHRIAREHQPVG